MEIKAIGKYFRISAKKTRLVADLIRRKNVKEAIDYLDFIPKKASGFIKKVLKSVLANAEHNFNLKKENLFIKEIKINEGPALKRWRPRAFGRAGRIRKKSAHIEIILGEINPTDKLKKDNKKDKVKESEIKTIVQEEIKENLGAVRASKLEKEEKSLKTSLNLKPQKGERGHVKNVFRRKSI